MPFDSQDNIFMIAGPVKIHRRVLNAMSVPAFSHRSKEFQNVIGEIKVLLQYLFQSKNEVAVISGSGTAGIESAISSLLKKDDKILCFNNGKFGERVCQLGKLFANATELKFPWGKPLDLEKVEEKLKNEDFTAVGICHNETSTALTNQAKEVAELIKKHGKQKNGEKPFYILDGITSIGGIPVDIDGWGVDIAIFGSQKCIAGPAGLACLSVSEIAFNYLHDNVYYLNLKKHIKKMQENDTPYTPAIPLFFGLREALRMIKEEGLENRIKRTEKLANACRKGVDALGLELFPEREYASNTLTAIKYPKELLDKYNVDKFDSEFRKKLREEHNVVLAGAQDEIKGKVFRIGHMGICSFNDLIATFGALEVVLRNYGYKVKDSGVKAIVESS